jgi:hypothetical protein
MIKCKCGRKFKNIKELREHCLILKPSVLCRYPSLEKENESKREHEVWKQEHGEKV